jgi:pimeloyl-ACP methyl ester carboxylesterase
MSEVRSSDGTPIAYEKSGEGPALILVDGALCSRSFGGQQKVAERLADRFTVYLYDRRGRGGSGDAEPYAVEREIEDLQAVIAAAGGTAGVYGISSGAALALETARETPGITKLALYEPPFIVDGTRPPVPADFIPGLRKANAEGRPGDAVKMFMRLVGVPAFGMAMMQLMRPVWRKLKAAAHTLPYDLTILEPYQRGVPLPPARWASVTAPALVMSGGKAEEWMANGARGLADVLPNADHAVLEGQTHQIKPKALAPALAEFFAGPASAVAAGRASPSAGGRPVHER